MAGEPTLWRTRQRDYPALAGHLRASAEVPTLLPWPMPGGWAVSDFARQVDGDPGAAVSTRATLACVTGHTDADGRVDLFLVVEDPGSGLGARCAKSADAEPAAALAADAPGLRVVVGHHQVPLWSLSTSTADADFDRSVFVGELDGRWLWLIVRPAPAALLLGPHWPLRDVRAEGAHLLDLPFSGDAPQW